MHDETEAILEAVHTGNKGCVLRDSATSELPLALVTVYDGGTFFAPLAGRALLDGRYGSRGANRVRIAVEVSRIVELMRYAISRGLFEVQHIR